LDICANKIHLFTASLYNIHMMTLLATQVFIALSEFKLHHSCIRCCLYATADCRYM